MSVWGLAAVFLLAAASPNLQACDGGAAVPDPENNSGLVADCKVLLGIRDELTGTGYLNWDTRLAMDPLGRHLHLGIAEPCHEIGPHSRLRADGVDIGGTGPTDSVDGVVPRR